MLNKNWLDENREILHSSSQRIPERLREIDQGYFVVFNHKNSSFEIHHKDGLPNDSFQLWIPFKELDQRTIDRVLETRIENSKALMALMERQNEKLEEDAQKKSDEITEDISRDIYRYCNNIRPSKDTIDDDAYKTRFL